MRRQSAFGVLLLFALVASACGSSGKPDATEHTSKPATSAAAIPTPTSALRAGSLCGTPRHAPASYRSIVVFSFENRTWNTVGDQFAKMPYLHGLAEQCASFPEWTETDVTQDSLTQYVGQVTGARQPATQNDCAPSASCSTTADNLFRQARHAHLTAVNYVEGASAPCSDAGNAAKHIPALYMWTDDDRAHCADQVRPYSEFDVNSLPNFAFITPTLCHDGHDCGNADVDAWAAQNIQPVLDSAAYRAGDVAVFVWYDEDHPAPNLWIAPSATPGSHALPGAGYAGTLAAWEHMLGLRCIANACNAPDMREAANV